MKTNFKQNLLNFKSKHYRRDFFTFSMIFVLTFSALFTGMLTVNAADVYVGDEVALRDAVSNAVEPTVIIFVADIQLTDTPLNIDASKDITLISSGTAFFKLIGAPDEYTITVNEGGILVLAGIIVTHPSGTEGLGVYVESSTLSMTDGEISGNTAGGTGSVAGGGIHLLNSSFTMSGGKIFNNTAITGGGVSNINSSFSMYNGSIAYNTATSGGGVYNAGNFTLSGSGVISNNTVYSTVASNGDGGGVHNTGIFVLSGNAAVSNNTAEHDGGGVFNFDVFTMSDNAVLSGNFAGGAADGLGGLGGGVYNGEFFELYDNATISNNTATSMGGGVYNNDQVYGFSMFGGMVSNNNVINTGLLNGGGGVYNAGLFNMVLGVISNNIANDGGGVYNMFGVGDFEFLGGEISSNIATRNGGGIYNAGLIGAFYGSVVMSGGVVSNNSAASGGGVYNIGMFTMNAGIIGGSTIADANTAEVGGGVFNTGTDTLFTMSGNATISGNSATSNGGGVHNEGNFSMFGGMISNNTAVYGGGVYIMANNSTFVMNNGTISNNIAMDGGGIYLQDGLVRLNGGSIIDNTASNDGGGVWVSHANLNLLFVSDSTIFSNNRASTAYDRNPTDNALYYAQIGPNVTWTTPFIQGYNNYDISYTNGTPFAFYNVTVNDSHAPITGAGSYPTGATVTVNAGTRPGYTFTNWTINQGNITLPNNPTANFTMPPTNVDITANWQATIYNITYILNGGTNDPHNPNTYTLDELPLSINNPTRPGHNFTGWTVQYTNGQPDINQPTLNYTIPANTTGNITLTAHWTEIPLTGTITVTKLTCPSGADTTFTFITNAIPTGIFTLTDSTTWNSGNLAPGSYIITEIAQPGWNLNNIIINDPANNSHIDLTTGTAFINLSAGETIDIIYQNTQAPPQPGSISVTKVTCPTSTPETFNFITSAPPGTFNLTGGASWNSGNLAPGSYIITEIAQPGWNLNNIIVNDPTGMSTIDLTTGTVTLTLQPGNHVSIIYQNTQAPPQPGTISVIKSACPTDTSTRFTYITSATNEPFTLANGEIWNSGEIAPGRYTITEIMQPGWTIANIIIIDPNNNSTVNPTTGTATIDLQPGTHVTLIYQNDQQTRPDGCNQNPCDCQNNCHNQNNPTTSQTQLPKSF